MKLPAYQELSKEQDGINSLPLEASHLVTGPPGTGKTVMALYRAEMLSRKGAEAQLLMYSRLLSSYVESAVDELDLAGRSSTYHSWLYKFYRRQYGRNVPEDGPYRPAWTDVLTHVQENPPSAGSTPFLIVDEGQDLPKEFFLLARYLARHMTVFADENQILTEHNSTLDEIRTYSGLNGSTHMLRRNYRNTREIAALAACFYTGLASGIPDLPAREGDRPALIAFDSLHATVDYIARFERNNPDLEIGVLTPTKRLQKKLVNRLTTKTSNAVQSYTSGDREQLDFTQPGIRVINYQSAKGLEFDTVFLPELQSLTDDLGAPGVKMKFYVMLSRARDQLFLSYSGAEEPSITKMFPADLVERRKPPA